VASLGRWPRSEEVEEAYAPRADAEMGEGSGADRAPAQENRPDIYYCYRQLRMNLRMLPGTRDFGLDFELLLKITKGSALEIPRNGDDALSGAPGFQGQSPWL
jgi:hypothetical protein